MDDSSEEFEVLSGEEMRKKYYADDEELPVIKLDAMNVPEPLRSLIPLAERWGIDDDILREEALERASEQDLAYLNETVSQFDDLLTEWLAGPEAYQQDFTPEYIAFTCMRMAAEDC